MKGHHSILCYVSSPDPVTVLRSEYFTDDDATILVSFGPDHTAFDLENPDSSRRILEVRNLDLDVIGCTEHDWVADRYGGQAWAILKKRQFIDGWNQASPRLGRSSMNLRIQEILGGKCNIRPR